MMYTCTPMICIVDVYHVHVYTYDVYSLCMYEDTGWQKSILTLHVSICKRATDDRVLCRKMAYKDNLHPMQRCHLVSSCASTVACSLTQITSPYAHYVFMCICMDVYYIHAHVHGM